MHLVTTLSFHEALIHVREDQLCLTDMWRAAGGPKSKRPSEWLRSKQAQELKAFLEDSQGMGPTHTLSDVPGNPQTGEGGSKWAHWHLSLAYAKYLSPEFHVWCNTVVRNHMEGRNQELALPQEALLTATQQVLQTILELQRQFLERLPEPATGYVSKKQVATLRRSARAATKNKPITPLWRNIRDKFHFDSGRVFETVTPDRLQDVHAMIVQAGIQNTVANLPPAPGLPQQKPKVVPLKAADPEYLFSPQQICTMLKQDLGLDFQPQFLFDYLELHKDAIQVTRSKGTATTEREGFQLTWSQYQALQAFIQEHLGYTFRYLQQRRRDQLANLGMQTPKPKRPEY